MASTLLIDSERDAVGRPAEPAMSPAQPGRALDGESRSDRLDLERWLKVLRRRWWVIAACAVLVAGSAAAFSLTQQKQYTATASLLFSQSQIGDQLLGLTPSSPNDSSGQIQADQVQLVQSSQVAARTARALGRGYTAEGVTSLLSIAGQGQSDFVSVQATDPDPIFAAKLANLYARQFITFRRVTSRNAVIQVRASLQDQLNAMTPAERRSATGASLQARIEQLDTLAAAQTGDVQLVQPASVPSSPSSPNTKLNIGLGAFVGLLLGLGLALLLERLNRRVRTIEELRDIYEVPVLAELPDSSTIGRDRGKKTMAGYEQNSFDMLRARLRYFPEQKVKSLLVTSCAPQEGKTTIAWNLAETTALSKGSRVLLIEADLRRPSVAQSRDLQDAPGLSDVLSDQCDFSEAIQEVPAGSRNNGSGPSRSFDVLVAGPVPPNPAELIESDRMHKLVTRASEIYDLVVVDSGPALIVPEAMALIDYVAGVLIVSHVGRTTREEAGELRDQLRAVDAPLVGVVANRVKHPDRKGYYQAYTSPVQTRSKAVTLPKSVEGVRAEPGREPDRG